MGIVVETTRLCTGNIDNLPPLHGVVLPSRGHAKKIPLERIISVRREMAKVYRDMRLERIASDHGSRLIYALRELSKMLELEQLERRIDLVERKLLKGVR